MAQVDPDRGTPPAEDGYELWLRYRPITPSPVLEDYRRALGRLTVIGDDPSLVAAQGELLEALPRLLGATPQSGGLASMGAGLVLGLRAELPDELVGCLSEPATSFGDEGFALQEIYLRDKRFVLVFADTGVGVLYGVFHLLRLLQTRSPLAGLCVQERPRTKLRMLNHWDNLDRTVERGYAGFSLWEWQLLPDRLDPRYTDYARAMASVGLNAMTLTNVNSNALVLTEPFLRKVQALADLFRPYGIRVFLTARFSAPLELGDLPTADPSSEDVQAWWSERVSAIYRLIPDFGGFTVKANSEGQPGPNDYGRSQAEGANLLADALRSHGGVVIWRAFIYDDAVPVDRHMQAYDELVPLDGSFRENAILQAKNGAIDFQPREPFHPLFGSMPHTNLVVEFQLTQEYLGCATHLVYLGPLIKETLTSETYVSGAESGSTVAQVVDGSVFGNARTGMVAVSNIGSDRNWCGHPFAAANWYAFGRLAWDHRLSAQEIADEWLRMTFSNDEAFVDATRALMMESREACVDYMTPLGLHHIMARNHHYGPGPWVEGGRADWTSVYYHRADADGIGFDRTLNGSGAVAQYRSPLSERFGSRSDCDEALLLWFHHVGWQEELSSGRTLWDELCLRYQRGVAWVEQAKITWGELASQVDSARFAHVQDLLAIQLKEAEWWRDACLAYFQEFSRLPLPEGVPAPAQSLASYRAIRHYYVPGISNPFPQ